MLIRSAHHCEEIQRLISSASPMNQWSCEEEVMRHPAFWTSLPLTGHSLATRPALNNSETAPKTQHRHCRTGQTHSQYAKDRQANKLDLR